MIKIEKVENNIDLMIEDKTENIEVIKDVSKSLDDELVEAFELEMYLKRYEKKMLKRFKKIYNFSRFNFK